MIVVTTSYLAGHQITGAQGRVRGSGLRRAPVRRGGLTATGARPVPEGR